MILLRYGRTRPFHVARLSRLTHARARDCRRLAHMTPHAAPMTSHVAPMTSQTTLVTSNTNVPTENAHNGCPILSFSRHETATSYHRLSPLS